MTSNSAVLQITALECRLPEGNLVECSGALSHTARQVPSRSLCMGAIFKT